MEERKLIWAGWSALKKACQNEHKKKTGPGGAAMCICGEGCGGSEACSMLRTIKDIFQYMPTKQLPEEWRKKIEMIKESIY